MRPDNYHLNEAGLNVAGPHDEAGPDDAGIAELLRQIGVRDEPSAAVMQDVQAAVFAEWQEMVAARRRRRRTVGWSIAATALLAVAVGFVGVRFMQSAPHPIATVTRVDGRLLAASDQRATRDIGVAQGVSIGDTIQTDDRSRAALVWPGNLSLRLDRNTIVRIAAADELMLTAGALYVDSPSDAGERKLIVETRAGSVRHVGTQYQVRTRADEMEISIREGRVLIANAAGTSAGTAGERIRMTPRGEVERTSIAPHDADWHWAASAAPTFDINDQSFAAFAAWVARETGRKVVYASPAAEAAANNLRLRGSIAGLDPDTALRAVLSTTQLRLYETQPELIGIAFASASD